MAAEMTAQSVRAELVNGLFPPVRTLVVSLDRLETECRELREKHGAGILPASFWTRLASVIRARDAYLEAVEG